MVMSLALLRVLYRYLLRGYGIIPVEVDILVHFELAKDRVAFFGRNR